MTLSAETTHSEAEIVLVRYGELFLKGNNRIEFERALVRNIRAATAEITKVDVERRRGRIAVFPEARVQAVAERLTEVFGISSVSPAYGAESAQDDIVRVASAVLDSEMAERPGEAPITFRVRTSRGDKRFPLNSTELDCYVADRILEPHPRLRVRLSDPDLTLGIDVRQERTYVFASRLPGPGGLPVGTQGRALCLLSGGIDSPVAAYLAMKRGCAVSFVTFHSPPYIGEGSKKKVADLVRRLARYQPRSRLFVTPFTEIQEAVRDEAPESYRTVLYRRMMQRIASRIAGRDRAGALVTGESLGQVASQTVENMTCIGAATDLLVLRPVISFDKEEIVRVARRIGTFEVSVRPEPDCCTVFMPSRPVIRGSLEICEEAEGKMDVEGLVARALAAVEVVDL